MLVSLMVATTLVTIYDPGYGTYNDHFRTAFYLITSYRSRWLHKE